MSYSVWRRRAILNMYNARIREFVSRYKNGRPTVVLLPGGMGSQLNRSMEAYQSLYAQPTDYDPVWIDRGTFYAGQVRSLQIEADGRDYQSHVVVADGPLRANMEEFRPYAATKMFFQHSDIDFNYLVFGYDWRRSLVECSEFLEYFLTRLRNRVFDVHGEDLSHNLNLLAHSQGGLVAKIFLHRIKSIDGWITRLITIATPFYGTSSHQKRYFIGEKLVNWIYPPEEVARIVATLPGPYNLMFLPKSTYQEIDAKIGLKRYPIRDENDKDGADPYDEQSISLYPKWINSVHLQQASQTARILAAEIPEEVANCVFNIRSTTCNDTPVELTWEPLPRNFQPDDSGNCPIKTKTPGKGDGTVPFWSAYHVSVKKRKEFTNSYKHECLMGDPQVLKYVFELINDNSDDIDCSRALKKAKEISNILGRAADCEIQKLFQDIANGVSARNDARLSKPEIWGGIYRELMK